MNNFYTYFNYNFFKIIKNNITNNNIENIPEKEKKQISKLLLKKETCTLIFVILNFLITCTSSIEIYKINYEKNIIMHILKDNIHISILWFIILTILPLITSIMTTKKLKSKNYLILLILYLISNLFNISMTIYFITSLINNIILGMLGIINIVVTLIINSKIIIKIKENYLKK